MRRKKISRWIFISIFYPQQEWSILLQKAIIPFLESNAHKYLLNYILHFGNNRGDYIGLSCEVPLPAFGSFIESTDEYFSDFLQKFPGHVNSCQARSVFMNFPINSVCHSLHGFLPSVRDNMDADYVKVWHRSSVYLTRVFGNDPFDKEDFFTTALYLNLLLLLSCEKAAGKYLQRRVSLIEAISNDPEYREQFNETELVLREVWQDCVNIINGEIREDLESVTAWFNVFNEFIQPLNNTVELQSSLLEDMLITVRRQLCIVSDGCSLIDFFIDRLLQSDYHLKTVS